MNFRSVVLPGNGEAKASRIRWRKPLETLQK